MKTILKIKDYQDLEVPECCGSWKHSLKTWAFFIPGLNWAFSKNDNSFPVFIGAGISYGDPSGSWVLGRDEVDLGKYGSGQDLCYDDFR